MKPREYIKPDGDRPLVTKYGVVRMSIRSLNEVEIVAECLPVESGRFSGVIGLIRLDGWHVQGSKLGDVIRITPRRVQLLYRAIELALKKLPAERFEKAERIRLNNRICDMEQIMETYQSNLDRLIKQEEALSE